MAGITRITEMVAAKVLQALTNNGVLVTDREVMSYEIVPYGMPVGNGEMLLATIIFLAMPTLGGDDQVEHYQVMQFPHAPQHAYDELVRQLLEKIHAERAQDGTIPADAVPAARAGLLLPGMPGFSG